MNYPCYSLNRVFGTLISCYIRIIYQSMELDLSTPAGEPAGATSVRLVPGAQWQRKSVEGWGSNIRRSVVRRTGAEVI